MTPPATVSDPIAIRRAGPADAALVASLGARTFAETFGPDNTPEDLAAYLAEAFDPEHIFRELSATTNVYFVAFTGDTPVGYIKLRAGKTPAVEVGPRPVELERIYVLRPYAGRGIGSQLKEQALAEAHAQGYETLWLGVWQKNKEAIRVYTRWGFEIVGEQTFTLGLDVQHDWVMARPVQMATDLDASP